MADKIFPVGPGKNSPFSRDDSESIDSLQKAMDQFADDFITSFDLLPLSVFEDTGRLMRRVYITRGEKSITVTAELPGMGPDDIEIILGSNTLIITGEKKRLKHPGRKAHSILDDFQSEAFRKKIPIPFQIDAQNAKATFRNGVLQITLPKHERDTIMRRIPIKKTAGRF